MLLKFLKDKGYIKAGDVELIKKEEAAQELIAGGYAEKVTPVEEKTTKKAKIKE